MVWGTATDQECIWPVVVSEGKNMTKADKQFNMLKRDIRTTFSMSCHFCGTSYQEEQGRQSETADEFALVQYKSGWRVINSKSYQVIATACPECVAKNDKDR
jgi:hypothetical protein